VDPTEKMEDVALKSINFSSLSVVGSHCISRADNDAVLLRGLSNDNLHHKRTRLSDGFGFVDDMNTK
jgi:hypothetical protein